MATVAPVAAFVEVQPVRSILVDGQQRHGLGGVAERAMTLLGVASGGMRAGLHGCFHRDHPRCRDLAGQVAGGLGEVDGWRLLPR
jgi:hypothetical protein